MVRYGEAERFASRLRALRERAGYSYEALSRKTGISRSSLHRYCMGLSVPQDYGTAHRIATVCGATRAELRELHRLWALADTERGDQTVPAEPRAEGKPATEEASEQKAEAGKPEAGRPEATKTEPAEAEPGEPGAEKAAGAADDSRTVGRDRSEDEPGPPGAAAPVEPREVGADPAEPPSGAEPRSSPDAWRRLLRGPGGRRTAVIGVVTAVVLALAAWGMSAITSHTWPGGGTAAPAEDRRLLYGDGCEPVVSMGQQDKCVREVQRLLARHGARIGVDSSFGPETLRRVTAFQVLAGIAPNGVVGAPTRKALYESPVRMDTWSPKKVRERIRQVFTEAPDDAVAVADCQSFLDPLHILPNTDGTRNWGLFQISDRRLREMGGTPRRALDPEWNIQAARRLWSQRHDFQDWPNCARSLRPAPSATRSKSASTDKN
ncbi:helix-turn-helix domain-containing protein [Streptomyces sp. NPDC002701]|uniref:helix-turn-helix domain-containing protein n=1 Tax=Streptomyces sp. NPDC002701 TaxID=3364661 RepID=UPI0036B93E2F